ncbi:MAG TPA: methyltransferase domain-containing protein [Acidimicrobiales bacterium]
MRRPNLASAGLAAIALTIVARGLWLRGRLRSLAVLPEGGEADVDLAAVSGRGGGDLDQAAADGGYTVVTAAGVEIDPATAAAVVRHARRHGLDVVDLVPGDLPSGVLAALLTQIDPATYRHDRLALGRGAGHAMVVRAAVLDRLDPADRPGADPVADPADAAERSATEPAAGLDPVAYLELSRRLKRHAPTGTDLAVAPRLRAVPPDPAWRVAHLRALAGVAAPVLAPLPAAGAVLACLAPLAGRFAGGAVLAAYLAEPRLVAAGGRVRPRDIGAAGLAARPVRAVAGVVLPPVRRPPAVRAHCDRLAAEDARRRAAYAADAHRLDALLEPRRATCPWCGGETIDRLVTVPDLFQGKPGRFHLDECRGCGHVFQNPRLSPAGLDYYYRDFYDGVQREHTETVFGFAGPAYRARAAMLRRHAEPKRWLDVGTGHGYFCLAAQEMWPDTRFDGLDLTPNVTEAQRRGWVEQGFEALLPEVAADMTGGYDVVSMLHYLEHTRDPAAELDAARTVLEPGGHLLIEVPAPESAIGRRLGWLWGPWLQPQHQHFLPLANLAAALEERGLRVVAAERGAAHQPVDLSYAVMLLAKRLAPAGSAPWEPPPTPVRRMAHAATYAALLPLAGVAVALDHALVPVVRRRPMLSNAYRVLARKE